MKAEWGLVVFGALFMVPSMGWSIAKESKISSWTETRGTIVNLAYRGDESPVATVEYVDNQSGAHTVTETVSNGTEEGDFVDIRYDPETPSDAVVDHFTSKHFLTMILFPIGFIFSLVGFIIAMTTKPDQATKPS